MPTGPSGRRPTVLLADDHEIVLEGLAGILRDQFELVGTARDAIRLIHAARHQNPDVIVADIAMPGMSGLEALRRLRAEAISSKVIFLTMYADAHLAAEALRSGALGFLVKSDAGRDLLAAIQTVLRGGRYVTASLASDVFAALADRSSASGGPLTGRQREVVALIAQGRTMKEIGVVLGLSPRTVETHKYQVMHALGLQTTADLVRYALEHGLVDPGRQA